MLSLPFGAVASMSDVLDAVGDIIKHLVGGGSGEGAIAFADSWVGQFLSVITSSNGLFFIAFILSLCLFGLHVLKSLMNR